MDKIAQKFQIEKMSKNSENFNLFPFSVQIITVYTIDRLLRALKNKNKLCFHLIYIEHMIGFEIVFS